MLHTTLRLCRERGNCKFLCAPLMRALGPGWGEDDTIPFPRLLDMDTPGWAGLSDTVLAFRAVLPGEESARDRIARLFAADCAERTVRLWSILTPGQNEREASHFIQEARRFARGEITDFERDIKWEAARAWAARGGQVAWAAADTVKENACYAAQDAARNAAMVAGSAWSQGIAGALTKEAERLWQAQRLREYLEGDRDASSILGLGARSGRE